MGIGAEIIYSLLGKCTLVAIEAQTVMYELIYKCLGLLEGIGICNTVGCVELWIFITDMITPH